MGTVEAHLMTNALFLIVIQTSLKGTSFVSVYPCSTLGSALVMVDAEVHGVGMSSDSFVWSASSPSAVSNAVSSFECLNRSKAL